MRFFRRGLLVLGIACFQANPIWAFTQEVYVWQRQFSPAVYQAIESVLNEASGVAILAAEVNWKADEPHLFRSTVDYAKLATLGRPVSLVLRIGPFSGSFAAEDKPALYLAALGLSLLKNARESGLEPAELQLDFDCATSKLAGYRSWIEVLRAASAPTKIIFTALPDWLRQDSFVALANAADGYVLQVHSLEKPAGPDEVFNLCDPERAWTWIQRAGRIGVPFRVALPTYGYRLAFDRAGKFIALEAEGVGRVWPEGTQVRTVRADAAGIVALARKLALSETAGCTGVIWFRLPVLGDQLNWDVTTLKVALRGNVPASRLEAEVNWTSPGLVEVSVVNRGEQDESLPSKIIAQWADGGELQTGDGLGGYTPAFSEVRLSRVTLATAPIAAGERIPPGRSRKIAWLRFSHETFLNLQIVTSP
jgi:Protein of unknown function (DUF3142)